MIVGVALHYQYEGVQPGKDIAVKLSLNSWIASDIRREADATRVGHMSIRLHTKILTDITGYGTGCSLHSDNRARKSRVTTFEGIRRYHEGHRFFL